MYQMIINPPTSKE